MQKFKHGIKFDKYKFPKIPFLNFLMFQCQTDTFGLENLKTTISNKNEKKIYYCLHSLMPMWKILSWYHNGKALHIKLESHGAHGWR